MSVEAFLNIPKMTVVLRTLAAHRGSYWYSSNIFSVQDAIFHTLSANSYSFWDSPLMANLFLDHALRRHVRECPVIDGVQCPPLDHSFLALATNHVISHATLLGQSTL
jgi:hypothetical protein